MSLALFAASLALAASTLFDIIFFAIDGFSSKNSPSFSFTKDSTSPFTSLFPSFVFVWPSNWGDLILTLIIAVRPSLASSPVIFALRFFGRFPFAAY